jgi:hypothetical protein
MLAVFVQIMPTDRPTYFGESGTIASRGLNPALGFRPQIDVEDNLISYNPNVAEGDKNGFKKYVKNLQNFLDASKFCQIALSNVFQNNHIQLFFSLFIFKRI